MGSSGQRPGSGRLLPLRSRTFSAVADGGGGGAPVQPAGEVEVAGDGGGAGIVAVGPAGEVSADGGEDGDALR